LLGDKPATAAALAPVPVKLMVCGLLPALSVIVMEALRVPAELGVNVTAIVQLPPAATEPPQVLVSVKSPGLAPVIAIPETFNVPLPVLFRVTD